YGMTSSCHPSVNPTALRTGAAHYHTGFRTGAWVSTLGQRLRSLHPGPFNLSRSNMHASRKPKRSPFPAAPGRDPSAGGQVTTRVTSGQCDVEPLATTS